MPMCGFNKQMLDGLRSFFDGLTVQANKRAEEENVSIPDVLKIELCEMETFLDHLRDSTEPQATLKGLTLLARGFYLSIAGRLASDVAFGKAAEEANTSLVHFFERMDARYYGELRPKLGATPALKELAKWTASEAV